MAASGGVLGAFWVRALIIMRKRIIESAGEIERLTDVVDEIQGQIEGLRRDNLEIRDRLDSANRVLESGDDQRGDRLKNGDL
jgi:hypothetical protein